MVQIEYYISGKKIAITVSEEVAAILQETDYKEEALHKQDKRHLIAYQEGQSELSMFYTPKSVSALVEQKEIYLSLIDAISELTPAQQRRIRLHYFDGFSVAEIAISEGVRHQAISKSIKSAEKILKKFLK